MLNKLLKRCLPWQQRGKWVRIYIDWTDTTNPPMVKGPDWLNITVVDVGTGEYQLKYNPDDYYFVTDIKLTLTSVRNEYMPTKISFVLIRVTDLLAFFRPGAKGYVDMFLSDLDIEF